MAIRHLRSLNHSPGLPSSFFNTRAVLSVPGLTDPQTERNEGRRKKVNDWKLCS
jgi:hypothetical protein